MTAQIAAIEVERGRGRAARRGAGRRAPVARPRRSQHRGSDRVGGGCRPGVGRRSLHAGIHGTRHRRRRDRLRRFAPSRSQPRVAARLDFTGEGVDDGYGHGTHVAGMVAGNGRSSAGQNAGVAPGASIVSLKVLDHTGVGKTSDVIAAIEWVIAARPRIRRPRHQPLDRAPGRRVVPVGSAEPRGAEAVSRGFVVVTSAGNTGRTEDGAVQYGGVLSPANDPSVITVGAVDTNGTARPLRRRRCRLQLARADPVRRVREAGLVAPGRRITSTAAPFSYLATTFPERLVAARRAQGAYQTLSGTSMAASIVSGTVALMLEARPSLRAGDRSRQLCSSARSSTRTGTCSPPARDRSTRLARSKRHSSCRLRPVSSANRG